MLSRFFRCGHCQALAPQFALAAEKLKENDPSIPLAKVDCTLDKKICDSNGVGGYPTLKLFREGESVEYDGPRDTKGNKGLIFSCLTRIIFLFFIF